MELKEAIADHLEVIDTELSAHDIPLRSRPLHAGTIFVKDYVLEVSGDDKTGFEAKPWFAIIYHHVENWYREHYGPAFDRDETSTARGVVLIRGLPVELRVPLTRSRVETPGETAWLFFPVEVEEDEEPLSWLVAPPTLDKLDAQEKRTLLKQATMVGSALRAVRMSLMGVQPSDPTVKGLLEGVLAEFEAAARHIAHNDSSARGSALWSLQMAVERTLQAFAQHKLGTARKIHNLFELFDDVAAYSSSVDRNLLKKLPRDTQVMTDRYGLGGTPTLWETIEAYNAALSFVRAISRLFTGGLGGCRLLLKRPPWLSLPSDNQPKAGP